MTNPEPPSGPLLLALIGILIVAAFILGWCLHVWCEPAVFLVPADCSETHVYPSPGPGDSVMYSWLPIGARPGEIR